MAVLRLHETKNAFLFNQTSIVSFDGRSTLNIGLGQGISTSRNLSWVPMRFMIMRWSEHKRTGFGVELLTSLIELRANKYNAVSGTINYNGIDETALDGHDVKITGNLPYFYSSNVYLNKASSLMGLGIRSKMRSGAFKRKLPPI